MTPAVRNMAITDNGAIAANELAAQLDIFGFSPKAVVQFKPSTQTAREPPIKKTIGEEFASLWHGYCVALDAYRTTLSKLSGIEQRLMPAAEYLRAIKVQSDYTMQQLKEAVAKDMQKRLVGHAESLYAPTGTRLSIDIEKLRENVTQNAIDIQHFDPAKIWKYLETRYSGNDGKEMAWSQAAIKFSKTFQLNNDKPIERKGGYVILDRYVGMDDWDKRHSKVNRICHSGLETVAECYQSLVAFSEWAECPRLAMDLKAGTRLWDRQTIVASRKQFVYGEHAEVVLITFVGRFEFRIKERLAQQLQIFLGTYLKK